MTNEDEDAFLNEATHAVADKWAQTGGEALTSEELHRLNDYLTEFFSVKIQLLKDKGNAST
jgi:hypothetical protein